MNADNDKHLLHTRYAGMSLVNPFLLASGPPTNTGEKIRRAFAAGWAGAVLKTIPSENLARERGITQEPSPFLAGYRVGKRLLGLGNLSLTSELSLDQWVEVIPAIKREFPDRCIIGSIAAALFADDWKRMAVALVRAGCDALELDLSCSHATLTGDVTIIGEDPIVVSQVVGWVAETVDVPVIPKLPATVRNVSYMLLQCHHAGARGVAAINTVSALMGVDLETFEPQPCVEGKAAYCGYSGPGIKPIALRVVAEMSKGPLPVAGIGGISSWEDATEFLLLGARCVQVCTAVMVAGYELVQRMIAGLTAYLRRKGFESVSQIVGLAGAKLTPSVFDLQSSGRLRAEITPRCNRCGICVVACRDGAYEAIKQEASGPRVDSYRCRGCGLCVQVCPRQAIVLHPVAI